MIGVCEGDKMCRKVVMCAAVYAQGPCCISSVPCMLNNDRAVYGVDVTLRVMRALV